VKSAGDNLMVHIPAEVRKICVDHSAGETILHKAARLGYMVIFCFSIILRCCCYIDLSSVAICPPHLIVRFLFCQNDYVLLTLSSVLSLAILQHIFVKLLHFLFISIIFITVISGYCSHLSVFCFMPFDTDHSDRCSCRSAFIL